MLTAKQLGILRKVVMLGFVVFTLMTLFSCGALQIFDDVVVGEITQCSMVVSITEGFSLRNFVLYAALFTIVAYLLLTLVENIRHRIFYSLILVTMAVYYFRKQFQSFYDFLKYAFCRGLIHQQIYNSMPN